MRQLTLFLPVGEIVNEWSPVTALPGRKGVTYSIMCIKEDEEIFPHKSSVAKQREHESRWTSGFGGTETANRNAAVEGARSPRIF